ncbi:MAG TPA: translation initiation factor [Puia sp.]|uniref:translation initiation factor n=1 Tax=Puia sp. TaxID=2045100 RepID=UPI002B7E23F8|nr:translation initiation factor [Puia sp.]HVU99017.1 translation initiation factor [Puia sp.]
MSKKKANSSGIVYSTNPDFKIEEESTPQESLPPKQQRLKVRLDTRQRAGKAVTLVEGFIGPAGQLEDLGRQLKTHCGTGGSVKDGEILVQGDQRDKMTQWLIAKGFTATKRI